MSQPLLGRRAITIGSCENYQLVTQISTSLFDVFYPHSHVFWKLSTRSLIQIFLHNKNAYLIVEFLIVNFWQKECIFDDISSNFNPFKPHTEYNE